MMLTQNGKLNENLIPPTQTLYVEAAEEVTQELIPESDYPAQGYVVLREIVSVYDGEIIQ